jgi:Ca2+-transporting ATPase
MGHLQPPFEGLSDTLAAARLSSEGPNELPAGRKRTLWRGLVGVVREPMTALLMGCGAIYFVLGDRQEAILLLGFVVLIVGITLYQERKTERAIEALRNLASPRALVVRDGRKQRVPGREVVREDVVMLSEGDRVPADAVVLSTTHCAIDESLLTGESAAVAKAEWDGVASAGRPGGEGLPFVYAGTLVVEGAATAQVTATGERTEMGKIGRALGVAVAGETQLQRETRRLVWKLALMAGALSLAVVVIHGLTRRDWLGGVLAGLTLAMAILPNEFPVVVTVFLALGAWRLSRHRVLARRIPAVEALGSVTVLCVDKTGTLTQNRMVVNQIAVGGAMFDVDPLGREPGSDDLRAVIEHAALASRPDPFDPMEVALKKVAADQLPGGERLHPDWVLLREYPLTRERLAVVQVWRLPTGVLRVACKGAPEAVVNLCRLRGEEAQRIADATLTMAGGGLRVLGVARGELDPGATLAEDPASFPLRFLGLVGLSDPVRPTARPAIEECHTAGIRVVMISGDYPVTAKSIAQQVGLDARAEVLTGAELAAMNDAELRRWIPSVNVFARVLPEQKVRIVEALEATGEIVAMTGDGVNDAPALKAAHIGIAMGGRGTDVAREAAELVLLDDDFASLEMAVRTGRRIYDNLQKALAYILAVHLPILGLTLVPIVAGWPLVLMPIHIAFLHLVIDPACSVVFEAEPEEADVMRRPPRATTERLFGRRLIGISLSLGSSVTAILLATFALAHYGGRGALESRTITFTTLVLANLALIFTNRSWSGPVVRAGVRNGALWWVTGGTLAFLAAALYVPPLRLLFRFNVLHAPDLAICAGAALLGTAWFEALKAIRRRRATSMQRTRGLERPA